MKNKFKKRKLGISVEHCPDLEEILDLEIPDTLPTVEIKGYLSTVCPSTYKVGEKHEILKETAERLIEAYEKYNTAVILECNTEYDSLLHSSVLDGPHMLNIEVLEQFLREKGYVGFYTPVSIHPYDRKKTKLLFKLEKIR